MSQEVSILNHYGYIPSANNADYEYNLPLTSTIDIKNFSTANNPESNIGDRIRIYALENALNTYSFYSPHYNIDSDLGNKLKQELTLVSIPSIFFGSSIKKGTVELNINYSGTLVAKLEDSRLNGELIQTYPADGSNKCAGVVMYNHGFVILTGSWDIMQDLKWSKFGTSSQEDTFASSSFDINFQGINPIQTLTMMAHAPKLQFNCSNNPTFIKYEDRNKSSIVNGGYFESEIKEIKNITNYPYENYSGSLEKQVYISKIGIFDEDKNLIAIAKLAKPVRKTENRDFTFKLKLDF